MKAVLYRPGQIKLMNSKKNSLSIGIILSVTILVAVFFVSATTTPSVFSQQNTTDLPSTNNNTTYDANNSTLLSNATEGETGNLSGTGVSNSTVN